MKLDDFIKKLAETPRHWYWMGSKLRITVDGEVHCPLTAVAAQTKGQVFRVDEWEKAAGLLIMFEEESRAVMNDADFSPDEHWHEYHLDLRRRLVAACGLTE